MGNTATSINVVNYSSYQVVLTQSEGKYNVCSGAYQRHYLPCDITLATGNVLSISNEDHQEIDIEQKVVTIASDTDPIVVLIFNADGGFDSKLDKDLLQHIKLTITFNYASRAQGNKKGYMLPYTISYAAETLDKAVRSNVSVINGRLCCGKAFIELHFQSISPPGKHLPDQKKGTRCFCYIKDVDAPRYSIIKNLSSQTVKLCNGSLKTKALIIPPRRNGVTYIPSYLPDTISVSESTCLLPSDFLSFEGLLVSSQECPIDKRYRIGTITDNPRWNLALCNNSSYKLTVTLKSGKQKVVDKEVFVEYREVTEIKTSDGTTLGYDTVALGDIECGECLFTITQQDTTTIHIGVCDRVGG